MEGGAEASLLGVERLSTFIFVSVSECFASKVTVSSKSAMFHFVLVGVYLWIIRCS